MPSRRATEPHKGCSAFKSHSSPAGDRRVPSASAHTALSRRILTSRRPSQGVVHFARTRRAWRGRPGRSRWAS